MAGGLTQVLSVFTNSSLAMCPILPQETPIESAIKSFTMTSTLLQDQLKDLPTFPRLNKDFGKYRQPTMPKKIEKVKVVDAPNSVDHTGLAVAAAISVIAMVCFCVPL
jgi:hypothetical protein